MAKEIVGYKIIRTKRVGNVQFLLGHNPKAPDPYVTWKSPADKIDPFWGHYWKTGEQAVRDFNKRVHNEIGFER